MFRVSVVSVKISFWDFRIIYCFLCNYKEHKHCISPGYQLWSEPVNVLTGKHYFRQDFIILLCYMFSFVICAEGLDARGVLTEAVFFFFHKFTQNQSAIEMSACIRV